MDWLSAVKSFHLVVQKGSFTIAGEHLGISASAMSKRIDWLEKQLQTSLFIRTTRRITLTESGQLFLLRAEPWLEQFSNMLDTMQTTECPRGLIKIAATQAVGSSLLMPNIEKFLSLYPEMSVQLNVLIPGNEPDLEHDLVITRYHEEFDSLAHRGTHLIDYQMSLFASPDYLEQHAAIRSIEDLSEHKMLVNNYYQKMGHVMLDNGQALEFKNYNFVSENLDATLKAATQGMGVILISPNYIGRELNRKELEPVLPEIKSRINQLWAYYPKTSFIPLKTRLFVDSLKQALSDSKTIVPDSR